MFSGPMMILSLLRSSYDAMSGSIMTFIMLGRLNLGADLPQAFDELSPGALESLKLAIRATAGRVGQMPSTARPSLTRSQRHVSLLFSSLCFLSSIQDLCIFCFRLWTVAKLDDTEDSEPNIPHQLEP